MSAQSSMRHSSAKEAFTLVELLIVIAVIGIMIGVGFNSYIRGIRSAELREVATQVATELRRAKATAQRQSQDVELIFPTETASADDKKKYTLQVGTEAVQNKVLDKGVTMNCRTKGGNCGTATTVDVVYQAPYGELQAIGNIFELRSPMQGIKPVEIRIVGVTGKVIVAQGTP